MWGKPSTGDPPQSIQLLTVDVTSEFLAVHYRGPLVTMAIAKARSCPRVVALLKTRRTSLLHIIIEFAAD